MAENDISALDIQEAPLYEPYVDNPTTVYGSGETSTGGEGSVYYDAGHTIGATDADYYGPGIPEEGSFVPMEPQEYVGPFSDEWYTGESGISYYGGQLEEDSIWDNIASGASSLWGGVKDIFGGKNSEMWLSLVKGGLDAWRMHGLQKGAAPRLAMPKKIASRGGGGGGGGKAQKYTGTSSKTTGFKDIRSLKG